MALIKMFLKLLVLPLIAAVTLIQMGRYLPHAIFDRHI